MGFLQNIFKKWRDKKEPRPVPELDGKVLNETIKKDVASIASAKDRRDAMKDPFGRKNIEKRKKRMVVTKKPLSTDVIRDLVYAKSDALSPGMDLLPIGTYDVLDPIKKEEKMRREFREKYPGKMVRRAGKDTKAFAAFKKEMTDNE